jgi:FkbM family methyltransferase
VLAVINASCFGTALPSEMSTETDFPTQQLEACMFSPDRPLTPFWHVKKAIWTAKGTARRRALLRIATRGPYADVRVPHTTLRVDLRDHSGFRLFRDGSYEVQETAVIRTLIPPGGVVLDIGANLGYYTSLFATIAGTVYAIEPTPNTLTLLRQNTRAYPNVTVLPIAVSDYEGFADLYLSTSNSGQNTLYGAGAAVHVPVTTVDVLCRHRRITRVDLIKMDIEGAEIHALRGMQDTLRANPHALLILEFCRAHMRRAGSTLTEWLDAIGPASFSCITASGEAPIDRAWMEVQLERHYQCVIVRRHS